MRRSLILVLLLVFTPSVFARVRAVRITTPLQVPQADAIAGAALARGIPGIVVGVRKGNAFYTQAWGDFDVEAHVPEHPAIVHQIASLSKQFTAAAILRLVEQGKVRLDDRLTQHLPELDARFDDVTIERLLSHTSGLLREFDDSIGDYYTAKTTAELIAAVPPPAVVPGTRFLYSNVGYFLLAVVIERASNQTYEQFLREEFFEPFGLEDTSVCGSGGLVPEGYDRSSATKLRPLAMSIFLGSGSLCSTAMDLLDWNNALVGALAVTPPSYTRMTTPAVPSEPPPYAYGFGLLLDTFGGRRRIWHNGKLTGFNSHLSWFPDEQLTIAVLVNASDPLRDDATQIANAIAQAMQ